MPLPLLILPEGVPMALNLMKAGHKLTVWNRTAAACQPLVDAGATLAATAAVGRCRLTPA